MPDDSNFPLIYHSQFGNNSSNNLAPPSAFPQLQHYVKMDDFRGSMAPPPRRKGMSMLLAASYALDWVILIAVGGIGFYLGILTPNKRPFQLQNHNISFPYTLNETVPMLWAGIFNTLVPAIIVAIIALVFVPGATVPPGTPKELIWKRKLWELHTGLLGLGLSVAGAWFVTNAMKNMFGKPRPDLLARCDPDLENIAQWVVGGFANGTTSNGQLVSAGICRNPNKHDLDDGFRSFPSGHASSSSAGLLYLSLFIASKFAITIPFLAPAGFADASSYTAFPSRLRPKPQQYSVGSGLDESYELVDRPGTGARTPSRSGSNPNPMAAGVMADQELSRASDPTAAKRLASHARTVAAVRLQAAAPPLYLLLLACLPTLGAIFIASSRWFDFRHHAFDIIVGFLIGVITAVFAFRYYHLPISQGAGWAWGPRSQDKAFWAGVGSFSYATDKMDWVRSGRDEEEALGGGLGGGGSSSMEAVPGGGGSGIGVALGGGPDDTESMHRTRAGGGGRRGGSPGSASASGMKRGYEGSSMASRASPQPMGLDPRNRI